MDKGKISWAKKIFSGLVRFRNSVSNWEDETAYAYWRSYAITTGEETFADSLCFCILFMITIPVLAITRLPKFLMHKLTPEQEKKTKLPFKYRMLARYLDLDAQEAYELYESDLPLTLANVNNPDVKLLADNKGIYKRRADFYSSACGFRIEKSKNDEKVKVILSQLPDNPGNSLTHIYEHFATDIFWLFLHKTPVENIEWYDYWPKEAYKSRFAKATLEKVSMKWKNKCFSHHKRRKLTIPEGWEEKNKITAMQ
jgi:hypothetical protein